MEIRGKTAVVTGGASGMGAATARAYVERGARVAIFDLAEEKMQALRAELGDAVIGCTVDVSDDASVARGLQQVMDRFGALHICNNFAGIAWAERTLGRQGPHALDSYSRVLAINLIGTFNLCRRGAEMMARNPAEGADGQRGVIINTGSIAAYEGQMGQAAYSAAKGGVVAMTLPMARDLSSIGVRVNTIVPGLIHTPMCDDMPADLYASLTSGIIYPKRMGRPEEVAQLSVMMVENDYVNGACIRLDGALRLAPR